jgi:hypothetical protein
MDYLKYNLLRLNENVGVYFECKHYNIENITLFVFWKSYWTHLDIISDKKGGTNNYHYINEFKTLF